MNYSKVIAIDGPSGSGKSTLAQNLAQELSLLYVDTGAMFRALGYYCEKHAVPFVEGPALHSCLERIEMKYDVSKDCLIEVDGENLTHIIREHHVSKLASEISQINSVRKYLLDFQRGLTQAKTCVMEGRDIGTVVFPDAFCKIFLTASVEVRAKRRVEELENKGETITWQQVLRDVIVRDEMDMNRPVAPLRQAKDAILIDSSQLNPNEVVQRLKEVALKRAMELGIVL